VTTDTGRRLQLYAHASRASVPIEVMFELTQRCNLRCHHCYVGDFMTEDRLSGRRIGELLDELAGLGTLVVGFSGGEPLVRPDCVEIVRAARRLGFEVHLLTNATLVSEAVASELAPLWPRVHVSYYSRDEATFDSIAAADGAFARATVGILRLREHGVQVILKMPIMSVNTGHVAEVRRWARYIGAECRTAASIFPRRDGDRGPLRFRADPAELVALRDGLDAGCDGVEADGRPMCAAGARYAVVTATGDVLPCNVLPLVAGNVLGRSFTDVWRTSAVLRTLRELYPGALPVCGRCLAFRACGRCHAEALIEGGDLLGPSPVACDGAGMAGER
jgi:radical SAM protein with 4Fe4S-binding SPASM domain